MILRYMPPCPHPRVGDHEVSHDHMCMVSLDFMQLQLQLRSKPFLNFSPFKLVSGPYDFFQGGAL